MSISFFNNVANSNKQLYLPKNTNHALFIGNDDKTNNVYAEVDTSNATSSQLDSNNKFLDKRKKEYTNCSQIEKRYTLDLSK